MVFVFLCLDNAFYLTWLTLILLYMSRSCSSIIDKKEIYDNSRKANFEQNILFGPFQLYEIYMQNWKTYCHIIFFQNLSSKSITNSVV